MSETLAAVLVRRGLGEPEAAHAFLDAERRPRPIRASTGCGRRSSRCSATSGAGPRSRCTATTTSTASAPRPCSCGRCATSARRCGLASRAARTTATGSPRKTVEELHARGAGLLDHRRLRDRRRRGDRACTLARHGRDRHRPSPARARSCRDCPVVHPGVCGYPAGSLRHGRRVQARAGAVRRGRPRPCRARRELDIVALATVADLVPLAGENRTLVRRGLRAIAGCPAGRPAGTDAGRAASIRRASPSRRSASRSRRASTRPGASTAPTPGSSCC